MHNFITSTLLTSGTIALKYFRYSKGDIKTDKSLVSQADIEIEQFIRAEITRLFPDCGIMGEEFGSNISLDKPYFVIDPIDGTSSFVAGRAMFGIMLAYVENGSPVASGIYQPVTGELWAASSSRTTLNDVASKVAAINGLTDAIIATTSTFLLDDFGRQVFAETSRYAKQAIMGGDCYNYCLLASGHVHAVIEQGLKPYDFLPLIPIVEGAGGVICDWSGNALLPSNKSANVIACSSKKIADEILEIISGVETRDIS